ncbi:MAG: cytochrome [Verrucomicrobiaceae bacterium]|nr:cytochrome [Verrucomicrobiaceae bacterium]
MTMQREKYTATAMLLHWLLALLIISAFFLGLTMTNMPGITPTKLKYFNWHKWLGVTILALAFIRALWRLSHKAPPLPATIPRWQHYVSAATHLALYVLMFAVPLSGYFYSLAAGFKVVYLGLFPLPVLIDPNPTLKPILKATHYWLTMGMAALVVMHVGAALKHHFWDRDTVLLRMLPGRKKLPG